jgi:hypothetical protein
MEDILTSNVFGVLKYVLFDEGLLPFLSLAIASNNSPIFSDSNPPTKILTYDFWPLLNEEGCYSCEPDLIISLEHLNGSKSMVLIEAKFHSGKSSEEDREAEMSEPARDQLAREWQNLESLAKRMKALPYLVYVTAGFSFPRADVEVSLSVIRGKGATNADIYWLSWRELGKTLRMSKLPILKDLKELIEKRYQLTTFESLSLPKSLNIAWQFNQGTTVFNWMLGNVSNMWQFVQSKDMEFRWGLSTNNMPSWRYENE